MNIKCGPNQLKPGVCACKKKNQISATKRDTWFILHQSMLFQTANSMVIFFLGMWTIITRYGTKGQLGGQKGEEG